MPSLSQRDAIGSIPLQAICQAWASESRSTTRGPRGNRPKDVSVPVQYPLNRRSAHSLTLALHRIAREIGRADYSLPASADSGVSVTRRLRLACRPSRAPGKNYPHLQLLPLLSGDNTTLPWPGTRTAERREGAIH